MLNNIIARGKAWFSRVQSRSKRSHKWRQNASKKRLLTLREIVGNDDGETFARRLAYLRTVDPLIFEEWVLDAFQRHGWIVERGTRYSGDGGLDGKIYKNDQWAGVQCKRYKEGIKAAHIDDFSRVLAKNKLPKGYFVHTGRTPSGARHRKENVIILSGQELVKFLI